jgi:membrane-anchored protein YejM (alkaline phosphatase superfamily)
MLSSVAAFFSQDYRTHRHHVCYIVWQLYETETVASFHKNTEYHQNGMEMGMKRMWKGWKPILRYNLGIQLYREVRKISFTTAGIKVRNMRLPEQKTTVKQHLLKWQTGKFSPEVELLV